MRVGRREQAAAPDAELARLTQAVADLTARLDSRDGAHSELAAAVHAANIRHDVVAEHLAALAGKELIAAVDARVDDLAAQLDALRVSVSTLEARLQSVGMVADPAEGSVDAVAVSPDRYAPAPAGEPWTEEYNAAHRAFVSAELDDPTLLTRFRDGDRLPDDFGIGFDERVVEFPWLAARRLSGTVLDAGSTLNHLHVLGRLRAHMDALHIVTLEPEGAVFPHLRVSYLYADLRTLPMADATYDRVLSLSTLEHVGMDNAVYGHEAEAAADPQAELLTATRELWRVLKPAGDLYITVPTGAPDRFAWVRNVTPDDVDAVAAALAPSSSAVTYFRYDAHGWQTTDRDGVEGAHYRDHFTAGPVGADRAAAAGAVACLHLVKPG